MGDDELIAFITRSRGKGKPDDQIARTLVSVGWKKERVDAAFAALAEKSNEGGQPAQPQPLPAAAPQAQPAASAGAQQNPQPAPVSVPPSYAPPEAKPQVQQQSSTQQPMTPSAMSISPPPPGEILPEPPKKSLFSSLPFGKKAAPAATGQQPSAAATQQPAAQPLPVQAAPDKKPLFGISFPFGKKNAQIAPQPAVQPQAPPEQKIAPPVPSSPPWAAIPLEKPAAPAAIPQAQPPAQSTAQPNYPAQPAPAQRIVPPPVPSSSQPSGASTAQPQPASGLKPLWPDAQAPPAGPPPVHTPVADESQVKNPAFSNLGSAAGTGGNSKLLVMIAAIIILVGIGIAGYYFFVLKPSSFPGSDKGAQIENQPKIVPKAPANKTTIVPKAPAKNTTAPAKPQANATAPKNNTANASANSTLPVPPNANITPNATGQNITQNRSNPVKPANTTAPPSLPAQNNSSANTTTTAPPAPQFLRTTKHSSSVGVLPSRFCRDLNGELYRIHYTEFWGGECSSAKDKGGFVNESVFKSNKCALLPCCFPGPFSEYSTGYDYFECGYNTASES